MKEEKGFTLIELLAVIVIIAIVLAIAIPRISNYEKDRKKDLFFSVAKNILREIEYENIGSEESLPSILSSIKIDVSSNQIDIDKSKVYRDIDGEITINLFGKGSYDGLYLCNVKTSSKKANYEDNSCLSNKISVNFNPMGGGINLTKKEVNVGETYGELPIPVKENYAFIGWFYNNEKIEETTRVECNINHVLIAKYKYNTKLTVDLDDGTTTQTFNERYQEGETITLVAPVKTNYTFTGWKIVSGNAIMSGNSLTFGSNDVVIKALYQSNTTSITLNLDGGTISTDVSGQYTIGQTITLETPTKPGYDFSKWQITIGNSTLSGNKLTIGTQATTIKAIWIKKVTLTLNLDGGTISSNASGVYLRNATVTLGTPTKNGYAFSKWQITTGDSTLSGNKLTIGTQDTTIKAIYIKSSEVFAYTGSEQKFTAPVSGKYKIEVWGAQGGGFSTYESGFGGYSFGTVSLNKNDVLYINVGGKGTNGSASSEIASGGYNGGGNGGDVSSTRYNGGGGGATHIATASGLLSTLSTNQQAILIVAGGGGGAGGWEPSTYEIRLGGSGGGFNGVNGEPRLQSNDVYGVSGKQTESGSGGTFGQGRSYKYVSSYQYGIGGGGGGFYGGGVNDSCAGGGGSGYIGSSRLTNKAMYCYNCTASTATATKTISTTCTNKTATENCAKKGNGYAKITYIN